jgi:hypothetical protein
MQGILLQREDIGYNIFWEQQKNEQAFDTYIKNLSDKDLFIGTLNILAGDGAFKICYAEMLSRIGTENIFDKINTISKQRGNGNDQIKDTLTISCITTLLSRRKITDLQRWVE